VSQGLKYLLDVKSCVKNLAYREAFTPPVLATPDGELRHAICQTTQLIITSLAMLVRSDIEVNASERAGRSKGWRERAMIVWRCAVKVPAGPRLRI
jgi:hypothetical protein